MSFFVASDARTSAVGEMSSGCSQPTLRGTVGTRLSHSGCGVGCSTFCPSSPMDSLVPAVGGREEDDVGSADERQIADPAAPRAAAEKAGHRRIARALLSKKRPKSTPALRYDATEETGLTRARAAEHQAAGAPTQVRAISGSIESPKTSGRIVRTQTCVEIKPLTDRATALVA